MSASPRRERRFSGARHGTADDPAAYSDRIIRGGGCQQRRGLTESGCIGATYARPDRPAAKCRPVSCGNGGHCGRISADGAERGEAGFGLGARLAAAGRRPQGSSSGSRRTSSGIRRTSSGRRQGSTPRTSSGHLLDSPTTSTPMASSPYDQQWPPPAPQPAGQWTPQYGPGGQGPYPPQPMQQLAPQPAGQLSPVRSMGLAVQVLLCIAFVIGVVQLISAFDQLSLLQRLADDSSAVGQAEADRSRPIRSERRRRLAAELYRDRLVLHHVVSPDQDQRRYLGADDPGAGRGAGPSGGGSARWSTSGSPIRIAADALKSSRPDGSTDTPGGGVAPGCGGGCG